MKSLAGEKAHSASVGPHNLTRGKAARPAPWLALLGVDGSGKSSVLRELRNRAADLPFEGIQVFHRRPRIVYQSATGIKGMPISHYSKPMHGGFKSWFKIAAMVLDWNVGYWRKIHRQRRNNYLVIADRHSLLDMLVDPERYRYGGSPGLLRLAFRLAPMPDLIFLLDAPEEILQQRKHELSPAQIKHLRQRYLEMFTGWPNTTVLDTSRPVEEIVSEILTVVEGYDKSIQETREIK